MGLSEDHKKGVDTGRKILIVCQHYYPENFQITPIAEQLAADGFEVTVLAGLPNYPLGVVPEEYKHGHRDEWINGVHILRSFEIGRRKGISWLAANYVSFMLSALYKVGRLKEEYDLVFIYQLSPILMALPGLKYARQHKIPVLLYCCDQWPESLKVYIKSERNLLFRVMKRVSRYVYSSADRVLCQSPSFVDYLVQTHGLDRDRLEYLPAFADESYLEEDFTPAGDTVDFVFMGNLGYAQDLLSVVKAVEKIRDVPGFMVHFVGDGSCLGKLKEAVKEKGLGDIVMFYGRRPVEEMPEFYRLADACLLSLTAENQIGYTLPAKMQGYMAAGKPVIGMINGSAAKVIEESGCGVCVAAGDTDRLADAMRDFIINSEKYAGCGEAGREYFRRNFRRDIFMQRLENEIINMGRNREEPGAERHPKTVKDKDMKALAVNRMGQTIG